MPASPSEAPVTAVLIIFEMTHQFALVPGLMMAVAWIVAAPALVVERTGVFGAFSRSAQLTRGRRWVLFALGVIFFIAVFIVQQVLLSLVRAVRLAAIEHKALIALHPVIVAAGGALAVIGIEPQPYKASRIKP